jgi:isopenicillin N synthase-like dioxygenase
VLKASPSKGPFNSQTVLYQTDAAGRPIGGIKIMIHDWNKDENRKIREQQFLLDEEEKVQISKVFSPQNIQNYLPIRNQELKNFITLYIPCIKTYNNHDFNLLDYLASCYKKFLKFRLSNDSQRIS